MPSLIIAIYSDKVINSKYVSDNLCVAAVKSTDMLSWRCIMLEGWGINESYYFPTGVLDLYKVGFGIISPCEYRLAESDMVMETSLMCSKHQVGSHCFINVNLCFLDRQQCGYSLTSNSPRKSASKTLMKRWGPKGMLMHSSTNLSWCLTCKRQVHRILLMPCWDRWWLVVLMTLTSETPDLPSSQGTQVHTYIILSCLLLTFSPFSPTCITPPLSMLAKYSKPRYL